MEEKKDYLCRDPFLADLMLIVDSLSRRKAGCTFAIDGKWGCGKSFLLDMFEKEAAVTQSEASADDRYFIVRYDCWKYNYYSEPIIAIIAAITDQIIQAVSMLGNWQGAKAVTGAVISLKEYLEKCGGKLLESRLGFDPISLYKQCEEAGAKQEKTANQYDPYNTLKDVLTSLKDQLKIISKRKTIVLVVDELDRCLPEYAIKVMESLHHIFNDIPNFITILAIDRTELKKVVKKAYGKKINASAYLRKILDFYLDLGIGNLSESYLEKYACYTQKFSGIEEDLHWIQQTIYYLMNGLDIRTQEKIMSKAELIHDIIGAEPIDYSCMAFEVFFLRLQNAIGQNITDKGTCEALIEKLELLRKNRGLFDSINILEDDGKLTHSIVRDGKEYICLEDNILCRVKWYIENLFAKEKEGCCGKYYFPQHPKHQSAVKKMKLFARLARLIE